MLPGYGRELFATFVPASARARLDSLGSRAALLSGAVVTLHRPGTVVELTWAPGKRAHAALVGALRAARHADAIVFVGVPARARAESPQAPERIVVEILAAARAAIFDRPLVILAHAEPLPSGASVDRLSEGLYRDVEAGFTSIAFQPAAFQGDLDALLRVTAPLVEHELGLEVELDGSADPALLLARIDDAGLKLSAVRGADPLDELGGAMLVLPGGAGAPDAAGAPVRRVLDERIARALARIAEDDVERAEAAAWLDVTEALAELGARRTASRLLDALAASLHATDT